MSQETIPDKPSKFRLKWSLKIKFITFTTLLIFVIMALNGMFIIIREKRLLMDKVISESTTLIKSLSIPVTNVFLYQEVRLLHEEELLESYISQIMEEKWPIKYAIILDNHIQVLVHSDLKEFGKIYEDAISQRAGDSWTTITQRYQHPTWGPILEASTPLAISSKRWGTLRVGFSLKPIQSRINLLYWEIIGVALGLALMAFIVVNYLSKKLIAPLSILTNEMKQTSVDQQQQQHISINSSDEIGYLARTFEDMRERLVSSHLELKQAQNQIIQAEKLASIGRLASGVAHEINNPLNGIQNCVRMIQEEPDNKKQTNKYLELIDEGLNKIESVMKKFLNYARQDQLIREAVDINISIKKMLELLEYKISKRNIKVVLSLDDSLKPVSGDPNLLEQVLLNLMINAHDAMEKGGKIKITTANRVRKGRKGVFFSIRDSGVGIAESEINKIFDPFYTTKDVGEGTGLGLSVCLGIVETHGGNIQVLSTPGTGTTFSIFIPRVGSSE